MSLAYYHPTKALGYSTEANTDTHEQSTNSTLLLRCLLWLRAGTRRAAVTRGRGFSESMIILERSHHESSAGARAEEFAPEPVDAYVLCLALLALCIMLVGWSQHVVRRPSELLVFGLLAAAAGSQKLWVPNSARSRVSIGYIFVMVGLLFLGVPEAMLIAAVSGLTGSLLNVRERPSTRESVFNIAALVLSAALAGQTLSLLGRTVGQPPTSASILPILAAVAAYFMTNSVLAAIAVALTEDRSVWGVWRQGLVWTISGALAGSSLAVLMALAYGLPDRTLFYLSLPLAYVLFAAYQATLERMRESRLHVEDLDRTACLLHRSFQRVGEAIAAPLDTAELHRLIVDLCHEMLAPQMSGLCLCRDGSLELRDARFAPTFPPGRNGSVADALQKAAATALERGQPTSSPADGSSSGAPGALAFAVPLQAYGVVHGALCVLYEPWHRLTEARRQLLTGFASQAALALQNARLFQMEQDAAETMRRSLLPPARVEARDLEIGTFCEPLIIDAGRVGGDYYDVLTLPDGRVAVSIADVCGKGMAAAVRTALAKYTVRAYAAESPWPSEVLTRTNAAFTAQEPESDIFTTIAYALLDTEAGSLALASAGHPPAMLFRAATGRCTRLEAGGPALGVVPGRANYSEVIEAFEPGDVLLLYTDGVFEARRGKDQFGLERIQQELMRAARRGPQEIAEAIVAAARDFAEGKLTDDVTLLVLKNTGGQAVVSV
jgi:serine phosphatase RsbU (regulator of sigma subunit)